MEGCVNAPAEIQTYPLKLSNPLKNEGGACHEGPKSCGGDIKGRSSNESWMQFNSFRVLNFAFINQANKTVIVFLSSITQTVKHINKSGAESWASLILGQGVRLRLTSVKHQRPLHKMRI